MNSVVWYIIDGKHLYIEQILAEIDYPILYVCIDDNNQRYLTMCVDPMDGYYLVAETDIETIILMLEDKITMKDAFRRTHPIWEVYSVDEDPHHDEVSQIKFADLSDDNLPDSGAFFHLKENEDELIHYLEKLKRTRVQANDILVKIKEQEGVWTNLSPKSAQQKHRLIPCLFSFIDMAVPNILPPLRQRDCREITKEWVVNV
ncbi:MAG: hypothetical protein IKI58_04170 [Oscillospiraceae bacterium]|nr:hypothetical protein [Oscillospiraceae bacterium]